MSYNLSSVISFVVVDSAGTPLPNIDVYVTVLGDGTHPDQYLTGLTDAKGGVRWVLHFDPPHNHDPLAGVYGVEGRATDKSGVYREAFFSAPPIGPRADGGPVSTVNVVMWERPK
jgi:hypothetical protein